MKFTKFTLKKYQTMEKQKFIKVIPIRYANIIVDEVCRYYGCEPKIILGKSRREEVVSIRYLICYFLRNCGFSITRIASVLNRNHATIIYALNSIGDWFEIYESLQNDYNDIDELLKNNKNSHFKKFYCSPKQLYMTK